MILTFARGGTASCVNASGRFRTSRGWRSGLSLSFSRVCRFLSTSMVHMTMTVPVVGMTVTNVFNAAWTIVIGFVDENYRKKDI